MNRALRAVIFVAVLSLFAVGCMSGTQVNAGDAPPTPIPTREQVVIPTTAPAPTSTAVADSDDADGADEGEESEEDEESKPSPTAPPTPTPTPTVTPTPTPEPTPTADIRPIPTSVPQPRPRPTSPPPVVQRPTPQPVAPPSPCAAGQVLINGLCSCPAGTGSRPGDGQCVRFCNQAELTITNSCFCGAGRLYDNGGQCVQRCLPGEIPDGVGGCKLDRQDS